MKRSDRPESKDMPMSADQFRSWRKSMAMKQKEAADALGLKKRMIQYYEKGRRDNKSVVIPKTVRLACYALSHGVADFDGENIVTDVGVTPQPHRPSEPPEVEPATRAADSDGSKAVA